MIYGHSTIAGLAVMSALISAPLAAQEIVGTAIVDGQNVDLFDDGTWTARADASGCEALTPHLAFCGNLEDWISQPPPNAFINAQYMRTPTLFGQYVSEPIGFDQGLTWDGMRAAVMQNAAAATGADPDDIPVMMDEKTSVDGFDAVTIAFAYRLAGLDFTMINTYGVADEFSFQIMAFEGNAPMLSAELREVHAEFTNLTELTE